MIKFECIGSGSSGNCYLLSTDTETLVLDAGISSKDVKISLGFDVRRIVGVCVTHIHSDHVQYAKEYEKLGIPVWKPYENTEQKFLKKQFGSFKVTCFDLFHDNVENRGFLIEVDNQTILYMTDFEYCKYVFAPKIRINHMLIEMNYDKNMVHMDSANAEHIFRGHAEKTTTLGFIESNITDALMNVILCHLSGLNADVDTFIVDTQKVAKNANIHVAERGLKLDLEIEPF